MTRRTPLQTLAITVLAAALTCAQLSAPVSAQPGQGSGKGQGNGQRYDKDKGDKPHHGRSDDQRGSSDDQHRGSDDQRRGSDDKRGKHQNAQQGQSLSPQQAAERARSQYGGQVLKVSPGGHGYQVRMLRDDGRVTTVTIGD